MKVRLFGPEEGDRQGRDGLVFVCCEHQQVIYEVSIQTV
jgi:hypothetical protein